jgi:hypothetical protein
MGKKPAEIQREIAQQRATIERRIHALEDRVADDVRDAGHAVSYELGERTHLNQYAEQRPMTTVLGAFGAGVFLGMASNRGGRKGSQQPSQQNDGGGLFSELIGAASGAIGGTVQSEVRQLIRDVFETDGSRGAQSDREAASQAAAAPEQLRP